MTMTEKLGLSASVLVGRIDGIDGIPPSYSLVRGSVQPCIAKPQLYGAIQSNAPPLYWRLVQWVQYQEPISGLNGFYS